MYLEQFKSLVELVDPLESERGIELDVILAISHKMADTVTQVQLDKSGGARIDLEMRRKIMRYLGVPKRDRLSYYHSYPGENYNERAVGKIYREKVAHARQRRMEEEEKKKDEEREKLLNLVPVPPTASMSVQATVAAINSVTEGANLTKSSFQSCQNGVSSKFSVTEHFDIAERGEREKTEGKDKVESIGGKLETVQEKGGEESISSVLENDSTEEESSSEVSSYSGSEASSESSEFLAKRQGNTERAELGDVEIGDEFILAECRFKCDPEFSYGEFFAALQMSFWALLRPGEWGKTKIEEFGEAIGEGDCQYRRVRIADSKGKRTGHEDTIEFQCVCKAFGRARPNEREPLGCPICPVHCVEERVWNKIKKLSAKRRTKMLLEIWGALGWPTDNRPSNHILHLIRIGAAMTAASGGIDVRIIQVIGRWATIETAILYERMGRKMPSMVAVTKWPIRKPVMLDISSKTLDRIVARLSQEKFTYPLGRGMREIGTQRLMNKKKNGGREEEEKEEEKEQAKQKENEKKLSFMNSLKRMSGVEVEEGEDDEKLFVPTKRRWIINEREENKDAPKIESWGGRMRERKEKGGRERVETLLTDDEEEKETEFVIVEDRYKETKGGVI